MHTSDEVYNDLCESLLSTSVLELIRDLKVRKVQCALIIVIVDHWIEVYVIVLIQSSANKRPYSLLGSCKGFHPFRCIRHYSCWAGCLQREGWDLREGGCFLEFF